MFSSFYKKNNLDFDIFIIETVKLNFFRLTYKCNILKYQLIHKFAFVVTLIVNRF